MQNGHRISPVSDKRTGACCMHFRGPRSCTVKCDRSLRLARRGQSGDRLLGRRMPSRMGTRQAHFGDGSTRRSWDGSGDLGVLVRPRLVVHSRTERKACHPCAGGTPRRRRSASTRTSWRKALPRPWRAGEPGRQAAPLPRGHHRARYTLREGPGDWGPPADQTSGPGPLGGRQFTFFYLGRRRGRATASGGVLGRPYQGKKV
jgi:hypothetical protein